MHAVQFKQLLLNYCFISEYACDNLQGQGLILTKIQKFHLEIGPYTLQVVVSTHKSDHKLALTLLNTKFFTICCDIFQGQLFLTLFDAATKNQHIGLVVKYWFLLT